MIESLLWFSLVAAVYAQSSTLVLAQPTNQDLGSIQCRLDVDSIMHVQYSPFLDAFVEVHKNYYEQRDDDAFTADDDYLKRFPIQEVKACWCTQYFNRNYEYCPNEYDACQVNGRDGPIYCFNEGDGAAFIRGFWFVCIFWFFALAYAFTCTEQGRAARAFFVRTFLWPICCRQRHLNERQILRRQIDNMIANEPDVATWLLRSAFLHERQRQRQEQLEQQWQHMTWWQRIFSPRPSELEQATHNNGSNNNNNLSEWQEAMELKVKRYDGGGKMAGVVSDHDITEIMMTSEAENDDQGSDNDISSKTPSQGSVSDSKSATKRNSSDEKEDGDAASVLSFSGAHKLLSSALSLNFDLESLASERISNTNNSTPTQRNKGNTHEQAEDEVKCAICLSTVQIGDRIGDIPCGHIYCIDCLKGWLKRKNHCPLCQRSGLATPARPSLANATRTQNDTSPASSSSDNGFGEESNHSSRHTDNEDVEAGRRHSRRSRRTSSRRHSNRNRGLIVSMPDALPSQGRNRRQSSRS